MAREPGKRPGHPLLAWVIILVCTLLNAWGAFAAKQDDRNVAMGDDVGISAADTEGRILVGAAQLSPDDDVSGNLNALDGGRLTRRHRVIVLSAELEGPDAARERLEAAAAYAEESVAAGSTLLPEDARVDALLRALYAPVADGDEQAEIAARADALSDDERQAVRDRLGWIGELAVVPVGTERTAEREAVLASAQKSTIVMVSAVGGLCGGGFLGFFVAVGLLIALATGKASALFAASSYPGGVLAEIFAAWFIVMTVPGLVELASPAAGGILGIVAFVSAFLTLFWGRVYRLPFAELRQSIGLHCGRGFFKEAAIGVVGCMAAVPLVFIGFLGTAALGNIAEQMDVSTDASHPIVGQLVGAGPLKFALAFAAAAIVAPLVEETFFRGVLYRHMRGATGRWGRGVSVLASGLASAFVFAAIHPQSWIAIPALGSLGLAFALIREWRDSLVAPMVAHGVWNGTLVTAAWLALG